MRLHKLFEKCLYFIQRPYIFRNIFSPILHVFENIIELIIPPKEHFPKGHLKSCKISVKVTVIMTSIVYEKGSQRVVKLGIRKVLKIICKRCQKGIKKDIKR